MTETALESLLVSLITDQVIYFPIRHHSPACARHLERLIRERKPRSILIEGPASFSRLIPLLLHPESKAPFALYTSFLPAEKERTGSSETTRVRPPQLAAYYPLCDYSPELVALRVGAELGASLRFIDLDYSDQMRAGSAANGAPGTPRVESLLSERHYQRSAYLQSLARRAGCRDHNDLWDHFFETRLLSDSQDKLRSVERFIQDVAAWCYFARADSTPEDLAADGTLARESAMASAIGDELEKGNPTVLVVTGGFHTVMLPKLVKERRPNSKTDSPTPTDASSHCLIRYSFEQLDALNGYAAGMPSPHYYDQLWQASARSTTTEPFSEVASHVLVDLGQLTRRKKLAIAVSPADEIAALQQSQRLAKLRGHPGPTREDLLDAIRSCLVKGAMDAEGEVVMGLTLHILGGTSIGNVPAEAGLPPLVEDFRNTATDLRLALQDSVQRKIPLDLYRKVAHRRISRLFHSLRFLEIPFASLLDGPDFVKGVRLERLFEHWSHQWTPQTESRLIEASVYGNTLEEATVNKLTQAVLQLEAAGSGSSAAKAVSMLLQACRMGLHRHSGRLLSLVANQANRDSSLQSLAEALRQLVLLWESREPLEAHQLEDIPVLIRTLFERVCYLLSYLADTPSDAAIETIQSMTLVQGLIRSQASTDHSLDATRFYQPLIQVLNQTTCPAPLMGGAVGLLYGDGRLTAWELARLLTGSLSASSAQAGDQTGFLIGLLRTCRELAWRSPTLVEAVDNLLTSWTQDEFIQRIPHLRLAFADLTPRETDQVAQEIAKRHAGQKSTQFIDSDLNEPDLIAAAQVQALVIQSLQEDGLGAWMAADPSTQATSEASQ